MRLIDVDAFTKDNAWKWEASGGSEDQFYSVEYLATRYSVEAVPVKFLKKWFNLHNNNLAYLDLMGAWKEHESK